MSGIHVVEDFKFTHPFMIEYLVEFLFDRNGIAFFGRLMSLTWVNIVQNQTDYMITGTIR